ncbi:putative oxidoreductase [Vulcaniibacterium tengchongense]|uniref:Putative oxidoreductase n=2 Tax=Vulcaniibacterium tengchongense TaxID=1273429 RepID=A0A3N4VAF6_9GAMM|nr:putative oxidoreductase [Vulcaniibacterium tengchongense]
MRNARNGRKPASPVLAWMFGTRAGGFFVPLALTRFALGSFFFASGFNKLFVDANRNAMLETISEAGIWWPQAMAPFVAGCETAFGALLAIGLLSRVSAAILLPISTTALLTVGVHQIPEGQNALGWYSWLLYLPETLYMLLSLTIIVQGSGPLGLDRLVHRSLSP